MKMIKVFNFPKCLALICQRKMTGSRPSPTRWGLGTGTTNPIVTAHQPTPENFTQMDHHAFRFATRGQYNKGK